MDKISRVGRETKQIFVSPWDTKRFSIDYQVAGGAITNLRMDIPSPPKNWRISLGFYAFSVRAASAAGSPVITVSVLDRTGFPITGVPGVGLFIPSYFWEDTAYGIASNPGPNIVRSFYPDGMLFDRSVPVTFLFRVTGADVNTGLGAQGYVSYRFENWS